jgi:hypothetical protein
MLTIKTENHGKCILQKTKYSPDIGAEPLATHAIRHPSSRSYRTEKSLNSKAQIGGKLWRRRSKRSPRAVVIRMHSRLGELGMVMTMHSSVGVVVVREGLAFSRGLDLSSRFCEFDGNHIYA